MYGLLAYVTLLATAISGLFHVSPITIVTGAAALTCVGAMEHRALYRRAASMGSDGRLAGTASIFTSFLHGLLASTAAYALGTIEAWLLTFA